MHTQHKYSYSVAPSTFLFACVNKMFGVEFLPRPLSGLEEEAVIFCSVGLLIELMHLTNTSCGNNNT